MYLLEELQSSRAPRISKEGNCQEFVISKDDLELFKAPYDGLSGGLGITEETLPTLLNEALQSDGPKSNEWRLLEEYEPTKYKQVKALYYYLAFD